MLIERDTSRLGNTETTVPSRRNITVPQRSYLLFQNAWIVFLLSRIRRNENVAELTSQFTYKTIFQDFFQLNVVTLKRYRQKVSIQLC